MTEYQPIDARTVAALKAIDGQRVTVNDHQLVEDVDGQPAGVTSTCWGPALVHIPWGRYGFPSRDEVYGPEDAT